MPVFRLVIVDDDDEADEDEEKDDRDEEEEEEGGVGVEISPLPRLYSCSYSASDKLLRNILMSL